MKVRDLITLLFKREPKAARTMVDPTGVTLRESKYDCSICGCPGYECVDTSTCPRAQ